MTIKWIINSPNQGELKCVFDVTVILECKFIYNEIKIKAYYDHFAEDMLEYADNLESCIDKIDIINKLNMEEIEKINKIKFIIEWLRFWGKHNYGFYVIITLD